MGALGDLLAETKVLVGQIPAFAGRVTGPGSSPLKYPWVVVRADRGEGTVYGHLRVVAHRLVVFVLYGTFDGVSQEEAEALAVGHYEAILAKFEQNVDVTAAAVYESGFAYEVGRVEWGGQAYYALVVRPGFETKEEVTVAP